MIQRCKSKDIACVETEERQLQDRRASLAPNSSHCDGIEPQPMVETAPHNSPQRAEAGSNIAELTEEADLAISLPDAPILDLGVEDDAMACETVYPEFFEHIMMPFADAGNHDSIAPPPDVSNYTQDLNFGAADIDFSFLDDPAAWTSIPLEETQIQPQETSRKDGITPGSEAGPRSEALKRSPWSWSSWIPPRGVGAFAGNAELNVQEDRVNAADQLTSPSARQTSHCSLEQSSRDQMIRTVTQCTVQKL